MFTKVTSLVEGVGIITSRAEPLTWVEGHITISKREKNKNKKGYTYTNMLHKI